jgi:hypothetical protein
MLRRLILGMGAVGLGLLTMQQRAGAATSASATISSQQLAPNSWQYSLSLTNTGDTTINTFWNAWIVYADTYIYDFLQTQPTSVSSPSGWGGGAVSDSFYSPGYYSIEWQSPTGLAPGQTLSGFTFTTPDDPSEIYGDSFFSGYPVRESWVYHGASQSEPGFELTPTIVPVPEPTTAALLLPAAVLLVHRRRARRN